MRLTKNMKTAFVRAVMDDVPKVDYASQKQKVAEIAAIITMPSDVEKAYRKHPEYFNRSWHYFRHAGGFSLPIPTDISISEDAKAEIYRLDKLGDDQSNSRSKLKGKIEAAANACTTLKALKDLLPEFVKYMPEDEPTACRTLPAVQNVVADFIKAGWPKNGKKPK